jgi:hypothetical protein
MRFSKILLSTLILIALPLFSLPAQEDSIFDTQAKDILIDIKIFEEDPFSDTGEIAANKIMQYAENSLRSIIYISEEATPWVFDDNPYKYSPVLVAAFVAGSIKPQLINGNIADHTYDGVISMFAAYKKVLKFDSKAKDTHMEMLIKHYNSGTLKDFLKLDKHRKPEEIITDMII